MNDLISPEYLEQQKTLHLQDVSYGISGMSYASDIAGLIFNEGIATVLDYGCGKGTLKKALANEDIDCVVTEYDPAIPGKDHDPEPAELVVCTDVLEHIEEDKLDNVLHHLRSKAMRFIAIVVSNRPALKSLPDGRNAHTIIRDGRWWEERLSKYMKIERSAYSEENQSTAFLARPYLLVGQISTVAVMPENERIEHVKENVKLTDKRLHIVPPHNRVAILACYGPSLQDTWPSIMQERDILSQREGCVVVSVSGAHDFLIKNGIVPDMHIECDPREHKAQMSEALQDRTEYLYASVCHPNVVKRLAGKPNLTIWHLDGGELSRRLIIENTDEKNPLFVGGFASVGLRAISVLILLGYRRFIIHGMDCSYRDDGTSHAGKHTGKQQKRIDVTCYGRHFVTAPVLLAYMKQFDELRNMIVGDPPDRCEIIMRGDGLLQHALLNTPGATEMSKGIGGAPPGVFDTREDMR